MSFWGISFFLGNLRLEVYSNKNLSFLTNEKFVRVLNMAHSSLNLKIKLWNTTKKKNVFVKYVNRRVVFLSPWQPLPNKTWKFCCNCLLTHALWIWLQENQRQKLNHHSWLRDKLNYCKSSQKCFLFSIP